MKSSIAITNKNCSLPMLPYPCAATPKQKLNNLLDKLMVGAIGAALAGSLLFVMALL